MQPHTSEPLVEGATAVLSGRAEGSVGRGKRRKCGGVPAAYAPEETYRPVLEYEALPCSVTFVI